MTHEWQPFTEDLVICSNCGIVCDETASNEEWDAECEPDDLLVDTKGGENPWQ